MAENTIKHFVESFIEKSPKGKPISKEKILETCQNKHFSDEGNIEVKAEVEKAIKELLEEKEIFILTDNNNELIEYVHIKNKK